MFKITITEDSLSNIINEYCSCGGRGSNDNCCAACSIWHEMNRVATKSNSQQTDPADSEITGVCKCGEDLYVETWDGEKFITYR